MIELIFVIVVLGILASVAIPKLAATRDDAIIAKGRANILAIRSGIISERQGRMFRGDSSYIASLGLADPMFGNVMVQPVRSSTNNGGWSTAGGEVYVFRVMNTDNTFTYDNTDGTFTCAGTHCSDLTD